MRLSFYCKFKTRNPILIYITYFYTHLIGNQGLWCLLSPCGHRITVETLTGKRLAVDVSLWLVQVCLNDNSIYCEVTQFIARLHKHMLIFEVCGYLTRRLLIYNILIFVYSVVKTGNCNILLHIYPVFNKSNAHLLKDCGDSLAVYKKTI